jgi:Zn-dependent M28 family amino/carboxypeptidase
VLSAHLDHVGIGQPIDGDRIYNGAMDNASGISTLLEIARLIRENGKAPRRSILFVAVTGEEKGLLGSKYFAAHPTVPASSMAANINFDMFLPLFPLRAVIVFGLNESDMGDTVRTVAGPLGIGVEDDPQPDRNLFVRSDQYSFIRRGVPALSFGFAHRKGTAEDQAVTEWLKKRYHAPSDDLKQPVDLRAADRFNHLMWKLVEAVANADQRPRWKDNSFFKRFAG